MDNETREEIEFEEILQSKRLHDLDPDLWIEEDKPLKDQFTLYFEEGMPEGTAQQKGVSTKGGKVRFYEKDKLKKARIIIMSKLLQHKPEKVSEQPIKLEVFFAFNVKDKKLWGKYKPTRPDTDNSLKLLKDLMTGIWYKDDSQVVDERVVKVYSKKASITIKIEELEEIP